MSDVAALLRAARRARRLTQRELAVRAQVAQSRVAVIEKRREDPRFDTVGRLLAAAGHRLYAAPTTRDDVAAVAQDIRRALLADDLPHAMRCFIQMNDNLVAERGLLRGVLAVAEPESTRSATWDAAIAGLVAYRLGQEAVPRPSWTDADQRFLSRRRMLRLSPYDLEPPLSEVPPEFLERGVLIWRDTLESV